MQRFSYFLYDCYDASDIRQPEDDPRRWLNADAEAVLAEVLSQPPEACAYSALCDRHGRRLVDNLLRIGLFRRTDECILLDATVIVREDLAAIRARLADGVARMTEALEQRRDELRRIVNRLSNGFDTGTNLYHLLCGAVFDGAFFDVLSQRDVATTSKQHGTGLDYLITVYEQCPELERFSNRLLCSYNRYSDGSRALQSFGDADGERVDFYRFSCQKRLGMVPFQLSALESIWNKAGNIWDETARFIETGRCALPVQHLLEWFGYVADGRLIVPVYRTEAASVVERLTDIVDGCLYDEMRRVLLDGVALRCRSYGTPAGEAANELYHMVFGLLNEALVLRGIAATPPYRAGEGRYMKAIEWMS